MDGAPGRAMATAANDAIRPSMPMTKMTARGRCLDMKSSKGPCARIMTADRTVKNRPMRPASQAKTSLACT